MVSVPEGIVANIPTTLTSRNAGMVKSEETKQTAEVPNDPISNNKETIQGQSQ